MSTEPGIDVDDLASIERDQCIYFMEMEHQLNDAVDWSLFRQGLVDALTVAYGWDPSSAEGQDRVAHATSIVDDARRAADPLTQWRGFCDIVWNAVNLDAGLGRRRQPV